MANYAMYTLPRRGMWPFGWQRMDQTLLGRSVAVLACPFQGSCMFSLVLQLTDEIFLSVDAWYLLKCDMSGGSLEEIIDMAHHMLYDHQNGTKFCTGELPVAHYMIPCVESLLRIRPW